MKPELSKIRQTLFSIIQSLKKLVEELNELEKSTQKDTNLKLIKGDDK